MIAKWLRKLSTGLIADRLGRTKNSVIGRIWRLKLSGHRSWQPAKCRPRPQRPLASKPEAPIMPPSRKEKSAPKPPQAPPPEAIWNALEGITPVTFMDLETEHCRWPVTGGFCGCQKDDDSSYCSTHRALASHPAAPLRLLNPHRTSLST
jgi:hypothetical protein